MDVFYTATFGILSLFTAVTLFYEQKQQKTGAAQTAQNVLFARFRNNYLTVFSLMMGRLSSGVSVGTVEADADHRLPQSGRLAAGPIRVPSV
jgi:hypothetical protein